MSLAGNIALISLDQLSQIGADKIRNSTILGSVHYVRYVYQGPCIENHVH